MWHRKQQAQSNGENVGKVAVRLILTLVFFACAAWLWFNQQQVVDQIAFWQYKPTTEVVSLADRSGMSSRGQFLFYASQPLIDGTQQFNKECGRKEAETAILGCYSANRIYVYDVKDARLDGIRDVTAAHEMLHAAYQRLSDTERAKVNTLVEAEYSKLQGNPNYKERMAFYARTEPGERDNELHSVIGTEVAAISPELEVHYATYFIDRSKVVALHSAYQGVFDKLQSEADALYAELQDLNKKINAASASYNAEVVRLNLDIQAFNAKASGGGFSSQSQFVSERATLVARANALGNQRTAVNNDVATYEQKRQEYNAIADESKQLNNSLDSNLATAPSV